MGEDQWQGGTRRKARGSEGKVKLRKGRVGRTHEEEETMKRWKMEKREMKGRDKHGQKEESKTRKMGLGGGIKEGNRRQRER